jgi:hypothetical protein
LDAVQELRLKLDQGLSAVTSQRASRGLVNSGGTLKALSKYATDLAQSTTDNYFDKLQAISALGQNAAGSLAGAGQSYANAVTDINADRARAAGQAAKDQADSLNGLLSAGLGALSNIGKSSYTPKFESKVEPFGKANVDSSIRHV